VVRLKGGDPGLFGRAREEVRALRRAGVPCEIVPGVSAAFAAAAELGVSLTERGVSRSVAFATPRTARGEAPGDWISSVLHADTAALYMAGGEAVAVAAQLLARGVSAETPVVAVESASLAGRREHAAPLGGLAGLPLAESTGPVLLLVGEVFRERLAEGGTLRRRRRA
jgi:uroporphyrin-III C-methyltransferase